MPIEQKSCYFQPNLNVLYRFFLTGAPLKVLSVRLHSISHQKSSKCQNLLTEKKLVIFRGHQLKKTPCILRERCYHDGISSISIIYQMVSHDGKPYSNHRLQRINAPKSLFWLLATNSLFLQISSISIL